jgi:hypothetical protein
MGARNNDGGEIRGGELVEDPQCGVYIPKEGAIPGPDGRYFCSQECLDAYRRRSQ